MNVASFMNQTESRSPPNILCSDSISNNLSGTMGRINDWGVAELCCFFKLRSAMLRGVGNFKLSLLYSETTRSPAMF